MIAQALLSCGANPDVRDNRGFPPVGIACSTFGIDSIRVLLDHGANINLASNSGTTPLLSSVFMGNPECAEILYGYDTLDPFLRTNHGYNNLELAAEVEHGHHTISFCVKRHEEGKPLPGLDLTKESAERLLSCCVNSDRVTSLELLWAFYEKEGRLDEVKTCLKDLMHRGFVRNSAEALTFLFERAGEIELDESTLELCVHSSRSDLFETILEKLPATLAPWTTLKTCILLSHHTFVEKLLTKFSEGFHSTPYEHGPVPPLFFETFERDPVKDLTYFPAIQHPMFSDEVKRKKFEQYAPLELAITVKNGDGKTPTETIDIVKALIKETNPDLMAKTQEGENLIHHCLTNKARTNVIELLMKSIQKRCQETETNFEEEFLHSVSPLTQLTVIDKASASSVYAPLFFKYREDLGEFNETEHSFILDCDYKVTTQRYNEKLEEYKSLPPEADRVAEMFPDIAEQNKRLTGFEGQYRRDLAGRLGLDLN